MTPPKFTQTALKSSTERALSPDEVWGKEIDNAAKRAAAELNNNRSKLNSNLRGFMYYEPNPYGPGADEH
jgi:hypothetical protein